MLLGSRLLLTVLACLEGGQHMCAAMLPNSVCVCVRWLWPMTLGVSRDLGLMARIKEDAVQTKLDAVEGKLREAKAGQKEGERERKQQETVEALKHHFQGKVPPMLSTALLICNRPTRARRALGTCV